MNKAKIMGRLFALLHCIYPLDLHPSTIAGEQPGVLLPLLISRRKAYDYDNELWIEVHTLVADITLDDMCSNFDPEENEDFIRSFEREIHEQGFDGYFPYFPRQ